MSKVEILERLTKHHKMDKRVWEEVHGDIPFPYQNIFNSTMHLISKFVDDAKEPDMVFLLNMLYASDLPSALQYLMTSPYSCNLRWGDHLELKVVDGFVIYKSARNHKDVKKGAVPFSSRNTLVPYELEYELAIHHLVPAVDKRTDYFEELGE